MNRARILLGLSLMASALLGARETVTYTYDASGRLTGAAYSGGTALTYAYDAAGNLLARRVGQALPQVSFLVASGAGSELDSPVLLTVVLNPPAAGTVTVRYAVTGGTASAAGVDFALGGDGTLVFPPGQTRLDIPLTVTNDDLPEGPETLQIALQSPTLAELGPTALFTYTIRDEDTDGDTLSDDWERATLGSLAYAAADDPDGDGANNAMEQAAGTDPDRRGSAPGPVGWWRFDEGSGTVVTDSSGNAAGGTVDGAAWVAGVQGGALRFDGSGDAVSVSGDASLRLSGFTLSAWLNTTAAGPGTILATEAGPGGDGYRLEIVDDGSRQLRGSVCGDAAGAVSAVFTTAAAADGAWHHVAFTRNPVSHQLALYVDGELRTTAEDLSRGAAGTTGELRLGASPGKAIRFFSGCLDEVRIYGYPRSAELMAAAAGRYTLTYQAGEHGAVTGDLAQHVVGGSSGTPVHAVPDPGYVFDRWSDGTATSSRTDTEATADLTVTALFRRAEPVPPVGPFLARLAATGVAGGRGVWDLSGTYTVTVAGHPLVMDLVHDSRGRVTGTATYTMAEDAVVTLPVRGSVKGSGGSVLLRGSLRGASPARTIDLALSLSLTVDAEARLLTGSITGSVKANGLTAAVHDALTLPIAAPMDGTWALQLQLAQGARTVGGNAHLELANGVGYAFQVLGKLSGTTARLTLVGAAADPDAGGIRIGTRVLPREDGTAELESLSARAYGQAVAW